MCAIYRKVVFARCNQVAYSKCMQTTQILDFLKTKKARLTSIRCALVALFADCTTPQSAPELIQKLRKLRLEANKTTIYRELTFLEKQGIIQEIDLGEGLKRYELSSSHHHFRCIKCNLVTCIGLDEVESTLQTWQNRTAQQYGYTIKTHSLTFSGLCTACSLS